MPVSNRSSHHTYLRMTTSSLTTATLQPRSGGVAKRLVILLHGYGANAQDLIGLAPPVAERIPDVAFVSPDAPFPCEMGWGRQWFSLADRSPPAMEHGIASAVPILQAYIDEQIAQWNLTPSDVALMGFSQGTMMALAAGPRRSQALGGIIGYCGALIAPELLTSEIRSKPPVLLVHGQMDNVVPFAAMAQAESALRGAGVAVQTMARPSLAHGIDPEGLGAGIGFLHKIWR